MTFRVQSANDDGPMLEEPQVRMNPIASLGFPIVASDAVALAQSPLEKEELRIDYVALVMSWKHFT